jgi:hypothetical protein
MGKAIGKRATTTAQGDGSAEIAPRGVRNERLVTLSDGRVVHNYSEEYRLYCEAKWLMKKYRTKNTRQKYLADVHEKRGVEGYKVLYDELLRQWKHNKEAEK